MAASRIAKVKGRIIFLIVSIITINGIKIKGVPCGTKWANIDFELVNQPKIISVSQRGKERVKVKVIWLDLVNTYGRSPKKLLNKTKVKREIISILIPLCEQDSKELNSL